MIVIRGSVPGGHGLFERHACTGAGRAFGFTLCRQLPIPLPPRRPRPGWPPLLGIGMSEAAHSLSDPAHAISEPVRRISELVHAPSEVVHAIRELVPAISEAVHAIRELVRTISDPAHAISEPVQRISEVVTFRADLTIP